MRHLPKTLLATLISSTFFLTPSFYSQASEPVDVDPKTPVAKEQSPQNPSLTQDDYRQILIDFENEQNTQCTIKCSNKDAHSIEIKRDDEEQANDDDGMTFVIYQPMSLVQNLISTLTIGCNYSDFLLSHRALPPEECTACTLYQLGGLI